jgi:type VII secretion protein EssB
MADEVRFELDGVPCVVDTGGDEWRLVLRRSLVPVRHRAELDLLAHDDDALLACRVTDDEDEVTLHLAPGDGTVEWSQVTRMPRADRLRALVNVRACVALADRGYAVLLHPGNLLVDRNLRPRLVYRGIAGVMPPRGDDQRHLLRQFQALVLATMDPRLSFTELLDGTLTLRRSNAFEREVVAAGSVDELAASLTRLHDEAVAGERATLVRVSRRAHAGFRHAAVWLGVLALGATGAAGYSVFVRAPFDARMLEADSRYIAQDYEGVIETLRPVDEERLPLTQRYALATSYLRNANLSEAQRVAVENGLSLSSEREFLSYWVQVGRGELDDALDRAKGLDDVDLVLYALTLLQEQVRADGSLSGSAREARLDDLQSEYDRYFQARSAALGDGVPDDDPPDGVPDDDPPDGVPDDDPPDGVPDDAEEA